MCLFTTRHFCCWKCVKEAGGVAAGDAVDCALWHVTNIINAHRVNRWNVQLTKPLHQPAPALAPSALVAPLSPGGVWFPSHPRAGFQFRRFYEQARENLHGSENESAFGGSQDEASWKAGAGFQVVFNTRQSVWVCLLVCSLTPVLFFFFICFRWLTSLAWVFNYFFQFHSKHKLLL